MLERYEVATRLSGTVAALWVEAIEEFIVRIDRDIDDFTCLIPSGRVPARVEAIQSNMGDSHEGGRSVFIVLLDTDDRVVYKPRPLGLDQFFHDLVEWVGHSAGSCRMRPLRCLTRSGYGWVEYADHQPCESTEQVASFYTRCGMLLALAYALNGTDFHLENLIAVGEFPCLIDMEALLGHPFQLDRLTNHSRGTAIEAQGHFQRSVLKVGLLPELKVEGASLASDIGGMGGDPGARRSMQIYTWRAMNTDCMKRVTRTVQIRRRARNGAYLGTQPSDPADFVEEVVAGFEHTYRLLLRERDGLTEPGGLLSRLRGQPVRFIFRPTSLYASILARALHPDHLRDGADRAVQLDVLTKPLLALDERPHVWPMIAAETEALERMDIPLFTATSDCRDLELASGEVIEDCFTRSAFSEVMDRFCSLSQEDLERQSSLIRGAFAANSRDGCKSAASVREAWRPRHERPLSRDQAIEGATAIARWICRTGLVLPRGQRTWFAGQYLPSLGRCRINLANYSLFDGAPGIALSLAALSHVGPEGEPLGQAARATIGAMQPELEDVGALLATRREVDLGAGTGFGSTIYGLIHLADLLDAREHLDLAVRLSTLLEPGIVEKATSCDLLSGAAGALLALLKLHEVRPSAELLKRAEQIGEFLLEKRHTDEATGLRVCAGADGIAACGHAHGQAGIAAALLRLSVLTNGSSASFEQAAEEAIEYERRHLGGDLEGAIAFEESAAWSHGRTGIALARLASWSTLRSAALEREVTAAAEAAATWSWAGPDTLCSGRMARVELLLSAGRAMDRPDWRTRAQELAAAGTTTGHVTADYDTGWSAGHCDPGLFQGMAGIGYQLLRVTHPELLPGILSWE